MDCVLDRRFSFFFSVFRLMIIMIVIKGCCSGGLAQNHGLFSSPAGRADAVPSSKPATACETRHCQQYGNHQVYAE